ncbi:MAG: protein kinase [Anaerolineae bacterium]|nr:protein kinase [Anaerolineae bacterium]
MLNEPVVVDQGRDIRLVLTFLQGYTLGKYRVMDPLGRGGMAQVYRAYHPQLDRYVAIKVMRPDLVDDELFLSRFRREARSVASLRHPNIIQVFDFDVQDGIYYMVMELLQGDTLKARLSGYRTHGGRMPWGEMARVLLDVLDGLGYAHSEGMIHRDIKPANVMLTQRGRAVLADFGIAQIVGGTQHTATGALMGTLNYMSPEQGLEGTCDACSDLYSLGIVFYEMLTDAPPFDADTPLAILMKHLNDPLPLPRMLEPDIPEPFERVVLKALAKRPQDRYQSAAEMAQALRAAAQAAGIELPEYISASLPSVEKPLSDSVVVLSGTARARIDEQDFARDETDVTLETQLTRERAAQSAQTPVLSSTPKAAKPLLVSADTVEVAKRSLSQFSEDISKLGLMKKRIPVGIAIPGAIGLIVLYNLTALWFGGWSRQWALFQVGWPIELLMIALALCIIMFATSSIWLLIPIWIVFGNGIWFSYFSLTNNWSHWAFLWPFEPALVLGAIFSTIWLSKRQDLRQRLARPFGLGLAFVCVVWSILVAVGSLFVSIVR